ncbi:MAG: hypothetical protein HY081_09080 [Gammaproteobacteria bacterium]|nr:hypothetical protein [Gammaproteobacteria bacterium]
MLRLFLFFLFLLAVIHVMTPSNLWFLPETLLERYPMIDLAYAIFIFAASFFGGWLQLYNLADRGLSLQILIDAEKNSTARIDASSVIQNYSHGKGMAWMYQKRLDDLVRLALIKVDSSRATLTEKGIRYAKIAAWLRKFFGVAQQSKNQPAWRQG